MTSEVRSTLQTLLCLLASACGGQASDALTPTPFDATAVTASLQLSAAPAFADERGGGYFIDLSGRVVRLRSDGTQGVVEAHPSNPVAVGPAQSLWPLGPYSALAATPKGLFVADSGWLIAPPWQALLSSEGLVGTAVGEDGVGWIAHSSGLFRLEGGALSELKVGGASVSGLTAIAIGPAPDGHTGVWYAQGGKLYSAGQTSKTAFSVRDSGLSAKDLEGGVLALAGVGPSRTSGGELWAITPKVLWQYTDAGWHRYDAGQSPRQLLAAGRFLWLQAGDALLRYDADAQKWGQAKGLAATPALLAVDAAGAAWVRVGDQTLCVSPGVVPRLYELFQNAHLYDAQLALRAVLPTAAAATALSWSLDDGAARPLDVTQAQPGAGPQAGLSFYSLGGVDAAGKPKPVSFAAAGDGRHTVTVDATLADGSATRRVVHFELSGTAGATLSYAVDIKPISDTRCAKCHQVNTLPELKTYEQWKANAAAISLAIGEKRMPADGPLEPAGIEAIQRWVSGGALP